ncbi:MAG: rod-binding protein [Fimbriimonadales bacterium]|nr:rod-binding protein [Fimbriimonadales bacterium]
MMQGISNLSIDRATLAKEQQAKLDALKEKPEIKRELSRLKKATQDIEAIFLKQLIGEMRKGQAEGIFGKSTESQMYTDFLDEAVAGQMAKGRGIGIADTLYKSMESVTLRAAAAKQAKEAANEDEISRAREAWNPAGGNP